MLGELDGGYDISEPGNANVVELPHERRIDLAAAGQIATTDFAAEQQVQRIARERPTPR